MTLKRAPQRFLLLVFLAAGLCCSKSKKKPVASKPDIPLTQAAKDDITTNVEVVHKSPDSVSQNQAISVLTKYLQAPGTKDYAENIIRTHMVRSENVPGKRLVKAAQHRAVLRTVDVESIQRHALLKAMDGAPLEALDKILNYYLRDSARQSFFNRVWKAGELHRLLGRVEPYPKYYAAEFEIMHRYLRSSNRIYSGPISDYLVTYLEKVTAAIEHGSTITATVAHPFTLPTIWRGKEYLSALNHDSLDKAFAGIDTAALLSGNILIPEQSFTYLQPWIKRCKPSHINELAIRYSEKLTDLLRFVKEAYIRNANFPQVKVLASQLTQDEGKDSGRYSKRLSLNYLQAQLIMYIKKQTANNFIATQTARDAMREFALVEYARLIYMHEHHLVSRSPQTQNVPIVFRQDNSELVGSTPKGFNELPDDSYKKFGLLYKRGLVREVIVRKQLFDVQDRMVYEGGYLILKNGDREPYRFTGNIPIRLTNRVIFKASLFRIAYVSFFERALRQQYAVNAPFFEFLDILNNYPEESLAALEWGIQNPAVALPIVFHAVRLNAASGCSIQLRQSIGLERDYQLSVDTSVSAESIFSKIASTRAFDPHIDNFLASAPSSLLHSRYNNVTFDSLKSLQEFDYQLNLLNADQIGLEAKRRLWALVQDRATRLPVKGDCDCYNIFCDAQSNHSYDRKRAFQINTAAWNVKYLTDTINQLSPFKFLQSFSRKELTPLGSVYDKQLRKMVSYFELGQPGNGWLFKAVLDSVKTINALLKIIGYVKAKDSFFLQRYNVDLGNLSDHGYEYLVQLTDAYIRENTNNGNSILSRILKEGYLKLDDEPDGFDVTYPATDNPLLMNFMLEHYIFRSERELVASTRSVPMIRQEVLSSIINNNNQIESQLTAAIQPDVNNINAAFDEADKQWNQWFVFVGASSGPNGSIVPMLMFSGGGLRVNISFPQFADMPPFGFHFNYY